MSNTDQFDWVDFYKEFAAKLLQFRNDRAGLVEKVKKIYEITELQMPTLERDNQLVDIDPFTVFGLFNKSLKKEKRIKILSTISEIFNISAPVPTSFDSIPLLNNQNATFYYFIDERNERDIDDLWELFTAALAYASEPSAENRTKLSKYFDLTINKKGNGTSKITMGMYWIAPDTFLNLDQRNTWYIYESGKIPEELVQTLPEIGAKLSAEKYFDIVEKMRVFLQSDKSIFKDFKELSFEAWRYSKQVNEEEREKRAKQEEKKDTDVVDDNAESIRYWIYSPGNGAAIWEECYKNGIMAIGWDAIGDLRQYDSKDEMKQQMKEKLDPDSSYKNAAHATWQFVNDMRPGDIVFAKKGMHLIVGRGVVGSEYIFSDSRQHYKNVRKVKWTHIGEWEYPGQAVMKTLTDLTPYTDLVDKLNALFENAIMDDAEGQEIEYPAYTKDDLLKDVFITEKEYTKLRSLILRKKNIILQGAPGVGKTFTAKRLAYSIIGEENDERICMVQFHQNYSYEDLIMGYRPNENGGFTLQNGVFFDFCEKCQKDPGKKYFFIIDEINRGNLSKIFGELLMLIETDKRGEKHKLNLVYGGTEFYIPEDLHIIGMMNTADRSLAMIDYALRRRFSFYTMRPAFENAGENGFDEYTKNINCGSYHTVITKIKELNDVIRKDNTLGRGFEIGHSYFSPDDITIIDDDWVHDVVEYEIIPLIEEYWFDDDKKIEEWTKALYQAIGDGYDH